MGVLDLMNASHIPSVLPTTAVSHKQFAEKWKEVRNENLVETWNIPIQHFDKKGSFL
jgi:hypothetical protein